MMKIKISKPKLNSIISLFMAMFLVFFVSGCGDFMQKDVLHEYRPTTNTPGSGGNTAVVIEDYSTDFTGILLAYNPWSNASVYSNSSSNQGVVTGNTIYMDSAGEQKSISTSSNRYIDAAVTQSGYVYFKERDSSSAEYVYYTNPTAEKKTLLANSAAEKSVVWSVSELNTFVYVDQYNRIRTVKDGADIVLYSLAESYSVIKLRYCEADGIIILLSTDGSNTTVLHRLDLNEKTITAVDVNVIDMSVVTSADKTAYIKTDSQGQRQLYIYDHNTLIRTYIMTGNIDRFALSPYGGYVAYATKSTDTGPTQSVWIVNCKDFTNVQVTANTTLASNIYWAASERELLFTSAETISSPEQLATVYRTYRLKFGYEYNKE